MKEGIALAIAALILLFVAVVFGIAFVLIFLPPFFAIIISRGVLRPQKMPMVLIVLYHVVCAACSVMFAVEIFGNKDELGMLPLAISGAATVAVLIIALIIKAVRHATGKTIHAPEKPSPDAGPNSAQRLYEENGGDGMSAGESRLLQTLKGNLTVDRRVFEQFGAEFKCNLVFDCGVLQLNFELFNTREMARRMDKDSELTIRANVYDRYGNLLSIEEEWVEWKALRSGYCADYFLLSDDSMAGAYSMRVYAIDPTIDQEDEQD